MEVTGWLGAQVFWVGRPVCLLQTSSCCHPPCPILLLPCPNSTCPHCCHSQFTHPLSFWESTQKTLPNPWLNSSVYRLVSTLLNPLHSQESSSFCTKWDLAPEKKLCQNRSNNFKSAQEAQLFVVFLLHSCPSGIYQEELQWHFCLGNKKLFVETLMLAQLILIFTKSDQTSLLQLVWDFENGFLVVVFFA